MGKKYQVILALFFGLSVGCKNSPEPVTPGYLSVSGDRFADQNGRTVILNGLNHVNKNPEDKYLNANDEELFKQFKAWGFNCIRYGIHWDGLEPEPGKINEEYLQEIDKRVKWAEENGLWLVLDMHQDLYGRKFDNGAPDWAVLDENLPHTTGEVWSAAYLRSAAVQKSFDNFWKNKPAADGVGVQDHYIQLWKTIARRYAGCPSVAGYDVMNEPFVGTTGTSVFPDLVAGCTEAITEIMTRETGKAPSAAELKAMWGDSQQRLKILTMVNDRDLFAKMVDKADESINVFDKGALSDFYQRIHDSIRTVDQRHIFFLEHSFFANLGVHSRFRVPLNADGKPDPLCAYAPHGYDLVTDTENSAKQGSGRLELIFSRLFEGGQSRNIPVWIGEWGAFYLGSNKYVDPARQIIGFIEDHKAGQAYWSYWDKIETQDYFMGAIVRLYPMLTNGQLVRYKNKFEEKSFECNWKELPGNKAPSRFFVPDLEKVRQAGIRLIPESEVTWLPIAGGRSGYLEIAPLGKERTMIVNL